MVCEMDTDYARSASPRLGHCLTQVFFPITTHGGSRYTGAQQSSVEAERRFLALSSLPHSLRRYLGLCLQELAWQPIVFAKSELALCACIKRESNPRRVDGNDPGYHYPINATIQDVCLMPIFNDCFLRTGR